MSSGRPRNISPAVLSLEGLRDLVQNDLMTRRLSIALDTHDKGMRKGTLSASATIPRLMMPHADSASTWWSPRDVVRMVTPRSAKLLTHPPDLMAGSLSDLMSPFLYPAARRRVTLRFMALVSSPSDLFKILRAVILPNGVVFEMRNI